MTRLSINEINSDQLDELYERLERAEAAVATPRELELRQRAAWCNAGRCPRCGYDDTDGRLCGDCNTLVCRLPSCERRQWRRYEQRIPGQPVMGHGYTPAQLLGITPAYDGPSIAEATANDRRWWNGEKEGE